MKLWLPPQSMVQWSTRPLLVQLQPQWCSGVHAISWYSYHRCGVVEYTPYPGIATAVVVQWSIRPLLVLKRYGFESPTRQRDVSTCMLTVNQVIQYRVRQLYKDCCHTALSNCSMKSDMCGIIQAYNFHTTFSIIQLSKIKYINILM